MSTVYNIINTAISNRINTKLGLTKPKSKNTMKTTMKLTKEEYVIKETNLIKETTHLWFDENENIKFIVRLLNNNITSIQNLLASATDAEIKEFKKQYYN